MKLHTKLPKNDTSSRKSAILATSIATLVGVSLLGFAPVAKAVQFWDTGLQNGILEGGSGTWDNAVAANWTNAADSLPHTTYAAGTNPAFFQGTAGTVTIAAANALAFSQLNFVASGYVVNGPGTLVLNNATNTINLQSPGTTTIAAPIRNGATGGLTVSNTGITGTLILTNAGNDYANGTTLGQGLPLPCRWPTTSSSPPPAPSSRPIAPRLLPWAISGSILCRRRTRSPMSWVPTNWG